MIQLQGYSLWILGKGAKEPSNAFAENATAAPLSDSPTR